MLPIPDDYILLSWLWFFGDYCQVICQLVYTGFTDQAQTAED